MKAYLRKVIVHDHLSVHLNAEYGAHNSPQQAHFVEGKVVRPRTFVIMALDMPCKAKLHPHVL